MTECDEYVIHDKLFVSNGANSNSRNNLQEWQRTLMHLYTVQWGKTTRLKFKFV